MWLVLQAAAQEQAVEHRKSPAKIPQKFWRMSANDLRLFS